MSAEADGYLRFDREEWSRLRAATPLVLDERDLRASRDEG